ncbi:TonB-dependent receptor [Sandaracinobacter neustonicus]|uniref:TonB-dependent receptor n=1 Tax=Sandaracinobacter neustonicus TaxID=1715348 RepID=A0A501XMX9_9SPHN|nr:TonB-dependent receptor [Sandaracinobacter neustonicus]TPE61926.1 TonB-dependent receptor [Sandaracinobacter neustonicus]
MPAIVDPRRHLGCLLLSIAALHAPAEAADASGDIVVTAQRRAQKLQDVPISMTALDSIRLADQAILNLDRLGANVPNLHLSRNFGTSSGALVFMRGVGEGDSIFTNDPPVGIYLDDVLLPRSTGALLDLIDIERIEVLRGPQGTLYGRNTSGGAIKLITKRPEFDAIGGAADIALGNYGRFDARATLNLPLAETVALRVSALSRDQRGWGHNLTNGMRVNNQDVKAGRAALLWEPDSRLSLFATADISLDRSGPRFPQGFRANPDVTGRYTNEFNTPDGSIDNFRSADTNPLNRTETGGASLRIDYRLEGLTLSSISGYRALTSRIGFDQTANAPGVGSNVILLQDQKQHSLSQELQLTGTALNGRADFVAGLFYFQERNDQLTAVSFATPIGTADARFRNNDFFNAPSRAASGVGTWSPYRPQLATDSWSAYASATVKAGPRASLTAGLRATSERKRYDVEFLSAPDTVLILSDGSRAERSIAQSWQDLSPRFAADYRLDGKGWSALAYASVSKGFRSGSFDGRARNIDFALNRQQAIAPESVWSYEAGIKSDWLANRLRLNIDYFINDYKNIAFSASRVGEGPPEIFRQNVGDARIQGLEAELNAEPLPGFILGGWIATLNDRFTRLKSSPGCTAFVANERDLDLRFTPSFSYQARASVEQRLGPGQLRIGGDYSAASSYNIALCNEPQHFVPNSGIANAQIRYEFGDWAVTLSATNLFDHRYNSGSVGSVGYPTEPRQLLVQGRVRF